MEKQRQKGHTLYPTKLEYSQILIQLFAKNIFGDAKDHALIGTKLFKQEVQSKRTLIFQC